MALWSTVFKFRASEKRCHFVKSDNVFCLLRALTWGWIFLTRSGKIPPLHLAAASISGETHGCREQPWRVQLKRRLRMPEWQRAKWRKHTLIKRTTGMRSAQGVVAAHCTSPQSQRLIQRGASERQLGSKRSPRWYGPRSENSFFMLRTDETVSVELDKRTNLFGT